jgi:predicted O-methyltransferase YrrM
MPMPTDPHKIREVRARLAAEGPTRTRGLEHDFETITFPNRDCDILRDLLITERVRTVVEIGLAYGSSALAIGEALAEAPNPQHLIIDPYQHDAFTDVGWDLLREAGLEPTTTLYATPSSVALPQLIAAGTTADAAFVDGSHRFHEVFLDLYYLRKIVRPRGLIVLDDDWAPSVRSATRYYERNLGWTPINNAFAQGTHQTIGDGPAAQIVPRCRALRLPDPPFEPRFEDFVPF